VPIQYLLLQQLFDTYVIKLSLLRTVKQNCNGHVLSPWQ